ncbi:MAG: hypothetical protein JRI68_17400 [Deltaproteobacteria bacterium]|nr:hypothetical protein [Deltaproteobacteria bacterium]
MRSLVAALMLFGTAGLLTAAGCNALLDIDHIDFGDGPAGGAGGGTGGAGASSGTGGTTSSTSSGGGTGGTGGSGGDGGAPAEDCTNGVDDNGDNLVDCADPICNDHMCVDQTIPSSWNGPIVLYVGTSAPNCAGVWPTTAITGFSGTLSAPPATCTNCNCGSVQGTTCPPGDVLLWINATCTGTQDQIHTVSASNTCEAIPNATLGFLSAAAAPVTPTGGSCSATGGSATVPPASFSADALLCAGATLGAGCSGTEACTPPPGSAFETGICIFRNGNRTCDPPFSVKHIIYTGVNDWRGCSNCSCSSPSGVSCNSTTDLFEGTTNATCLNAPVTATHGGGCEPVTAAGSMRFLPGTASGGSCSPSGGNPSGSASEDGLTTVCCTP